MSSAVDGLRGEIAIEVDDLHKRFGDVAAVRGASFAVGAGEVFGLLGPNGAGKSTTIDILCTLLRPTSGRARVAGLDVEHRRTEVRRSIGLVFQDPTLDEYLTVAENLAFHADVYGMSRTRRRRRIPQMLDLVGLDGWRDRLVRELSGGMQRRLEIARALLHRPRVLFLDEPTVGLDPPTRANIWRHVTDLQEREGLTILLTTHYLEEAEHCNRVAIIDRGEVVTVDAPDALKASIGHDRVELRSPDSRGLAADLQRRFDIAATVSGAAVTFEVAGGEAFVPRLLMDVAAPVDSLRISRPSLDDVFMAYTGRGLADEVGGVNAETRRIVHAMRRRR